METSRDFTHAARGQIRIHGGRQCLPNEICQKGKRDPGSRVFLWSDGMLVPEKKFGVKKEFRVSHRDYYLFTVFCGLSFIKILYYLDNHPMIYFVHIPVLIISIFKALFKNDLRQY